MYINTAASMQKDSLCVRKKQHAGEQKHVAESKQSVKPLKYGHFKCRIIITIIYYGSTMMERVQSAESFSTVSLMSYE